MDRIDALSILLAAAQDASESIGVDFSEIVMNRLVSENPLERLKEILEKAIDDDKKTEPSNPNE